MLKVIFHIDEMEKWNISKNNLKNFILASQGEDVAIQLLINGPAVTYFKDLNQEERDELNNFIKNGVRIKLCRNSLNNFSMDPNLLMDKLEVVQSGVVELTREQNKGFAYIKP